LDGSLNPLPAYTAFQFGRNEMGNAAFVREIGEYANVKGYEYSRGDRRVWVLWSLNGSTHSITLPGVPLGAWDALGNAVVASGNMNVSLNPLYLEWTP